MKINVKKPKLTSYQKDFLYNGARFTFTEASTKAGKTFYTHKLQELQTIKDALTKVKTEIKVSMRSKWYKSENATLQMGLMKLIGSDDERKRLSQTHSDITTDGKPITISFKD